MGVFSWIRAFMGLLIAAGAAAQPGVKDQASINRVIDLCDRVEKLAADSFDTALQFAQEAVRLSEYIHNDSLCGRSNLKIAYVFERHSEYDSSYRYNQRAIYHYRLSGYANGIATAYKDLSIVHQRLGAYDSALIYAYRSLNQMGGQPDSDLVAENNRTLGVIMQREGLYRESLGYFEKTLAHVKDSTSWPAARAYENIGISHYYLGHHTYAFELFTKARHVYSALKDQRGVARAKLNQATALLSGSDLKRASHLASESLEYFHKVNHPNGYAESMFTLAQIDTAAGNYPGAIRKALQVLGICAEIGNRDIEMRCNRLLASVYARLRKFEKAYDCLSRFEFLEDSLFAANKGTYFENLKMQQESGKLESALATVRQENEMSKLRLENQLLLRNGLMAGTALLLVAGLFGYRSIMLRRKLEKQQAVAEERRRISADLHDEIGSALSSINILSGIAGDKMETDRGKAREIIHRINSDAKRTHESMYDIIWEVKPENDSLEQMVTRMRQYASEILEASNIHLRFPRSEELKSTEIDPVRRHALYLIFKESINNIAKYSGASEAVVSLTRSNGILKLSVTDDGMGFDPLTGNQGNGIGNMKQRSKMMGAEFDLRSIPGKGTSLILSIPV